MAEYIERTEELVLAMNAGARAIENTKRYHGAIYIKDVFSESPQEIPYLQAAKVLREVSDAPAADVGPVVRCEGCKHARKSEDAFDWDGVTPLCECNYSRQPNRWHEYCSYGERKAGDSDA